MVSATVRYRGGGFSILSEKSRNFQNLFQLKNTSFEVSDLDSSKAYRKVRSPGSYWKAYCQTLFQLGQLTGIPINAYIWTFLEIMQSTFSCIKYNANTYTEFDHPNTIALQLLYLEKSIYCRTSLIRTLKLTEHPKSYSSMYNSVGRY